MIKCRICPLHSETANYDTNWVVWDCLWDDHTLGSYYIPGKLDTAENTQRREDKKKCYDQECSLSTDELKELIAFFQQELDSR